MVDIVDASKVEYSYGVTGTDRRYIDKMEGAERRRLVLRIPMPDDVWTAGGGSAARLQKGGEEKARRRHENT